MFNEHQEAYMHELAQIPPEQRCYCGWYRLGECPHCPTGKTCADKIAAELEAEDVVQAKAKEAIKTLWGAAQVVSVWATESENWWECPACMSVVGDTDKKTIIHQPECEIERLRIALDATKEWA